jgi:hypothetical protein
LAERRPADQSLEDRRSIMRDSAVTGSRGYWGWRDSRCHFCNWNCAEATVQTTQDMIPRQEDALIKAASGLEGSVVSAGSTGGVVWGGALSLVLMHDEELREGGLIRHFLPPDPVLRCLWHINGAMRYLYQLSPSSLARGTSAVTTLTE